MTFDAVLLSAGLGTRLRPLTHHRPKPLVPVCGAPVLRYAVALLARHGHQHAAINTCHLAAAFTPWHGRVIDGVRLTVWREPGPEPMGTGGALRDLASQLSPRVTALAADVLTDADLGALRSALDHADVAVGLRPATQAERQRYGAVGTDASGRIAHLRQRRSQHPAPGLRFEHHATGLHALRGPLAATLPSDPRELDVVEALWVPAMDAGRLSGVSHPGLWIDMGDPAACLSANLAVLTTQVPLAFDPFAEAAFARGPRGQVGAPPPGVTVSGCAWVGRGARVPEGAALADAIVGHDAHLQPGTSLTRVVVWDGVTVPAGTWRNGIFHDGGWSPVV